MQEFTEFGYIPAFPHTQTHVGKHVSRPPLFHTLPDFQTSRHPDIQTSPRPDRHVLPNLVQVFQISRLHSFPAAQAFRSTILLPSLYTSHLLNLNKLFRFRRYWYPGVGGQPFQTSMAILCRRSVKLPETSKWDEAFNLWESPERPLDKTGNMETSRTDCLKLEVNCPKT